jgi:hypothetical protein
MGLNFKVYFYCPNPTHKNEVDFSKRLNPVHCQNLKAHAVDDAQLLPIFNKYPKM